jgi:nicotinamidase-related amidase
MTQSEMLLRSRELLVDANGHNTWRYVEQRRSITSERLALILCDVWDHHWCRGAEERLEPMLPRMAEVVRTLRAQGATIIHAPSDTMSFYATHPARQRALGAPTTTPPVDAVHGDPPLPVDASDQGCDTPGCSPASVWTRQHPAMAIDPLHDYVTDEGAVVYNILQAQSIQQLLIMGVHTNMCILHRSFAIKQMVRWGVSIALLRDLTDTMYNPAMSPYVGHDEGTQLVIAHIEAHWCPTLNSDQLLPR